MTDYTSSKSDLNSPWDWGASLTSIYTNKKLKYSVDMCQMPTTKHYVFFNHFLGEVIFDKDTEEIISNTYPISEKYLKFLRMSLKAWKEHFKHF